MNEHERGLPGFYGKLPSLGDFVSRRLGADFIQPWDLWLRESLAESRARLGEAWLDTYLTSPLWRFVLTPGVAGQSTWVGVLMPSVDRVGRYYPLTLACPLWGGDAPLRLLCASDWFERAETLVLSGLEEGCSIESFDTQVLALGAPPETPLATTALPPGEATRVNAWRMAAPSPAEVLQGACPTLLARALEQVFCAYSLWWSGGSERVAPSFLACQGLPPPDGFSALLQGDWAGQGWWEFGCDPNTPNHQDAP